MNSFRARFDLLDKFMFQLLVRSENGFMEEPHNHDFSEDLILRSCIDDYVRDSEILVSRKKIV